MPRRRIYTSVKNTTISNKRVRVLLYAFIGLYLLILRQLYVIQIKNHNYYVSAAEEQYWENQEINAQRGNIYSSDGSLLAGTSNFYLMYAEPQKVTDKKETAEVLASALSELKKDFGDYKSYYSERFSYVLDLDLLWAVLERNISPQEKAELEKLELEGIGFEVEPVRFYPEGSLAAHVLGYVAQNEAGEKTGYYGIEGMFNDDLRGHPGRVMQVVDATGVPVLTGQHKKVNPIQGRNIMLTIDRAAQYIVEKKLKEGVENYNATSGSVIVMDPFTGNVLAMANFPTYYPDDFSKKEEFDEEFPNRKVAEKTNLSISQTYEPGSVIKPFTVAAAIDLGLVNPNTTFEDNGPVQYSDYVIDNWDGNHHGTQTITQLLQKSNNIGAAWVGHVVGSENLYKYFTSFGIGTKTHIELEGEDTGIINSWDTWTDIDLATASFGQGISATPLQVLTGFNALANGGYMLQPRIISTIIDETEKIEIPPKNLGRVVSSQTSSTMTDLLVEAAAGGEAKYFVLKNYKIAGKTGTAQIPVNGKYDPEKTNATFVGFVSESKKFSMIVKLEEPQSSPYAAETAVPLWMDIAQELVKLFGLPPDKVDIE